MKAFKNMHLLYSFKTKNNKLKILCDLFLNLFQVSSYRYCGRQRNDHPKMSIPSSQELVNMLLNMAKRILSSD